MSKGKSNIRIFKVLEINLHANSLYDLTTQSLETANSEPPVTLDMSDIELTAIVEPPLDLSLPCTTVAVERGVKTTTAASKVFADPIKQDGFSVMANSAISKNNIADRNRKSFIV